MFVEKFAISSEKRFDLSCLTGHSLALISIFDLNNLSFFSFSLLSNFKLELYRAVIVSVAKLALLPERRGHL